MLQSWTFPTSSIGFLHIRIIYQTLWRKKFEPVFLHLACECFSDGDQNKPYPAPVENTFILKICKTGYDKIVEKKCSTADTRGSGINHSSALGFVLETAQIDDLMLLKSKGIKRNENKKTLIYSENEVMYLQ